MQHPNHHPERVENQRAINAALQAITEAQDRNEPAGEILARLRALRTERRRLEVKS